LLYNKIFYSSLPIAGVLFYQLIVKFKFKASAKAFLTGRFAMLSGKYSYSFYILHFPIFFLIGKFINNPALYILMSISILILLAYFSENYFQKLFIKVRRK
jgi:peptidoglycan/LPS O-acetylase OafA/YrhL